MSGHVIYESRLELTRLLYADFGRGAEAVFVELRSCRYRGPALAGLAGQTSPSTGLKARGGGPVQANPDDITRVYFRARTPAAGLP